MTVASIAWRQLDATQRRQIADLLKHHPHYEKYLVDQVPAGVDRDEWAFMKAAVWSDWVRPARPGSEAELYKGPEITKFHRAYWHYVDKPWVTPADRKLVDPATRPAATQAATRPVENVLTALDANEKILANPAAAPADRAVALSWIMHLVGDIHQPLHAISMYTAAYPDGDRGGNEIVIRDNDNVLRLHSYWDAALGTSDAPEVVAFLAQDILDDSRLQRARLLELAERPAFAQWSDESHRLAIALAYLNGRLRFASSRDHNDKLITDADVPPVPHSYYANTRDLSRRRIALAAYRLSEQIVTLLPAAQR